MSSTISVRNLSEETQRVLKHRAVDNGRSFEAEIRAILTEAAHRSPPEQARQLVEDAARVRAAGQGSGFTFPERTVEYQREVFA